MRHFTRVWRRSWIFVLVLGLSGCGGVVTPFSNNDFSAYVGEGPATLEGQAFLRTRGGDLRYCAGESVLLAPATQYDIDVITAFAFGRDVALKRAGPAAQYWRESVCDAQGKFQFDGLSTGTWIVITDVRYWVAGSEQGGVMGKKVNLRAGRNRVIMNEQTLRSAAPFGIGWPE